MINLVAAKKAVPVGSGKNVAGDWYLAVMTATEEPASSTITGADVNGASPDDRFVAGSAIIMQGGNWVAFDDGEFSAKA